MPIEIKELNIRIQVGTPAEPQRETPTTRPPTIPAEKIREECLRQMNQLLKRKKER